QLEKLPETIQSNVFETRETNNNDLVVSIKEGYKSNDVLEFFINQGSNVVSFKEILPSLNEIFIRLVEGTPTARQFEKIDA
ncbi:MAG: DUF4162 domain-containing protein, partial [Bacteroidia bacterium]|nr:DUF4162 domain-containing protein [Bacteroidia bacterium]